MDSFDIQEELTALTQDPSGYSFDNEIDISSPALAHDLLQSAVVSLAHSSDNITDPAVFDAFRSLLKHPSSLQGTHITNIIDSISSAYQAQVEATIRDIDDDDQQTIISHRMPLEMYAFLLHWSVLAAEKVKTSGEQDPPTPVPRTKRGRGPKASTSRPAPRKPHEDWSWIDQIPPTLALIAKVLRLKTQKIWQTTGERDNFIA